MGTSGTFQVNPTLAAGDVQVNGDGGSFANIATLPTAIDAGATLTVALAQAEMNFNRIAVRFHDVAGAQWCDVECLIFTSTKQIDDLSTQTSVDDLPTNAELATALAAADDAILAQVALVKAKTDALPSDPADQSLIIAATDALATLIDNLPTNAELATALGTADDAVLAQIALVKAKTDLIPGTQDGKTFAQMMVLIGAALLGKASGLDTSIAVFRATDDSKDRITATVDEFGNRSAVTLDAA